MEGEEESQDVSEEVNPAGLAVHMIATVFFCHAALTYIVFPGYMDNWVPAILGSFLPIISMLFGFYYGLLGYWEVSWLVALPILFLSFGALIPRAAGYVCSALFVVSTVSAIYYTIPDTSGIPDDRGAAQVVYDRASEKIPNPRGVNSREGVETLLGTARTYRARCIRTNKDGCAHILKLMTETSRETLGDPRLQ